MASLKVFLLARLICIRGGNPFNCQKIYIYMYIDTMRIGQKIGFVSHESWFGLWYLNSQTVELQL